MRNFPKYLIIFLSLVLVFVINNIAFSKSGPSKSNIATPNFNLETYNRFPGNQELNLFGIEKKRQVTSVGVISPDMEKVAYSEVYFYPQNKQTSSKLFYVNAGPLEVLEDVKTTLSPAELSKIFALKKVDNPGKLILESGTGSFDSQIFRTLTVVDWSNDSRKLLVKEIIGEHLRGVWSTNIWVYDFDVKKIRRLDEVRKAIVYHWKSKYKLYLNDYRWDIVPLGWDKSNPDMVVVNAYGYNNDEKEFLGCWGIDFRGRRSQLLSLDNEDWQVSQNGLVIANK